MQKMRFSFSNLLLIIFILLITNLFKFNLINFIIIMVWLYNSIYHFFMVTHYRSYDNNIHYYLFLIVNYVSKEIRWISFLYCLKKTIIFLKCKITIIYDLLLYYFLNIFNLWTLFSSSDWILFIEFLINLYFI